MANKAAVNYYAKLIQRGVYKMEEVPLEMRTAVQKAYDELPPLEKREGEFETIEDKKTE